MNELDRISGHVVDAALRLHRRLGPGLMESVYEALLAQMLARRGLAVQRQVPGCLVMDGLRFEDACRADLLVESRLLVELKSVEKLAPVHSKQLLTYLRVFDLPVGLLINFGGATLKEGLSRIVNDYGSAGEGRLPVIGPPRPGG